MTNILKLDEDNGIKYEEALGLVKAELEHTLSKSPLIIREYTKHLLASQGKYIRAISVITAAEDQNGRVPTDAILLAAAIEIVHLASLVHDDIIDNADLRRGNVTLQKKYGKRTAVICGDYLLSIALRMAAHCKNKRDYLDLELNDYVGKVCLGELNQHINNNNINLSTYQYFKIISGKTAALFEASFLAGAITSGIRGVELNRYRQLGFEIGMIFQLTDDCMDFENTRAEAEKPVQSDYEQGVITLPLIHAFKQLSDFKEKAAREGVSRQEINEAVAKTGGLSFTRLIVKKYYNKAMKLIDAMEASESKKEKLTFILKKASRLE
jgi:heptaprenyl diphosphate synthase